MNALSVLSNQIISMALEYGEITAEKMFKIIKRAYPFHDLSEKMFYFILKQLKQQRNIWIRDNNIITKRRNSREYFLENISMIPDEKNYAAVDIASREKIGMLDESYVLNYGFEGTKLVLNGRAWKIVRKEEDKILLSPSKEIGEAPSWTGEDIPVPYEVATEVGRLRRKIRNGEKNNEYPCSETTFKKIQKLIEKQIKKGFKTPDDENITIEVDKKRIIINACFGTKVNETLGRIISAFLAQSIGESVGINIDPYRIYLETAADIPGEKIKKILFEIKPETLRYLLNTILRNSNYVRWNVIHAARKFGAIKKDFDYKKIGMKKLMTLFGKTMVLDEAIDKLIWDRMDVENTRRVLEKIQKNEIKTHIQKISPIATAGLDSIRGLMIPLRADRAILMALKKRIENTQIILVCTNCRFKWYKTVRRIKDQLRCPKCGAIKILVLKKYNKEKAELLWKKNRTPAENREVKRLHKNASLVLTYKKPAVYALMARGIGPDTAARILQKYSFEDINKSEEKQIDFLKNILKAELTYARTRGFWDK